MVQQHHRIQIVSTGQNTTSTLDSGVSGDKNGHEAKDAEPPRTSKRLLRQIEDHRRSYQRFVARNVDTQGLKGLRRNGQGQGYI